MLTSGWIRVVPSLPPRSCIHFDLRCQAHGDSPHVSIYFSSLCCTANWKGQMHPRPSTKGSFMSLSLAFSVTNNITVSSGWFSCVCGLRPTVSCSLYTNFSFLILSLFLNQVPSEPYPVFSGLFYSFFTCTLKESVSYFWQYQWFSQESHCKYNFHVNNSSRAFMVTLQCKLMSSKIKAIASPWGHFGSWLFSSPWCRIPGRPN